jgi:polyhydroxyalkanoate synthase subunit PhaE
MSEQATDWFKFWADNQKKFLESWTQPGANKAFAFPMADAPPDSKPGALALDELFTRPMEQWAAAWSKDKGFDPELMKQLFNPEEWKRAGSTFDMGIEKLTEGPTFATLWDLDRKMLNAQKLWIERTKDAEEYAGVVRGAWNKAFERFMAALNDPKGPALTSGRALLDLWLETANASLVEMHRTKEFLEVQRRMTRSSAEYRLQEREIAEAFCEIHHMPTRTEMDEVQREIAQLRRTIRASRRPAGAPKASPATVKPKAKARAPKRIAKK